MPRHFWGTVVEFIHHAVDLSLRDGSEIMLLGEILTNEAVGVLTQTALPG